MTKTIINCNELHSYDSKNPKIDVFCKKTKEYLGSTNWFKTCKAVKSFWQDMHQREVISQKSKR